MAQLVRAPPCHGGGRRFKSVMGRQCSVFVANRATRSWTKNELAIFAFVSSRATHVSAPGQKHKFKQLLRNCSYFGVLAQLGEHLPYKQRVIGSSPIGPTNLRVYAGVAELADAQDLKSCEGKTSYRFDSGRRQEELQI